MADGHCLALCRTWYQACGRRQLQQQQQQQLLLLLLLLLPPPLPLPLPGPLQPPPPPPLPTTTTTGTGPATAGAAAAAAADATAATSPPPAAVLLASPVQPKQPCKLIQRHSGSVAYGHRLPLVALEEKLPELATCGTYLRVCACMGYG